MASNVPSSAATNNSDPTHTVFGTLESFLQVYGNAEWVSYKRNTAAPHLSYEEWVSSEHVLGPYLYHLTLDAWDEATSSEDEKFEEPVKRASPDLPEQEPTVTTNGNGMPHIADSSAPAEDAKENEPVASTKKRQRRKKKFKSEAIVASDSDDIVGPVPVAEVATPVAAPPVANGRSSSLVQRHKKTSFSTPNLPPEDQDESPPLSKIVKLPLFALRKQKKKVQSDPIAAPEDEKESTPVAEAISPAAAIASPEGSSSSSLVRRGLRVRTPAQQRPYFHHAKLFEEAEVGPADGDSTKSPPKVVATKLAQVVHPNDEGVTSINTQDQEINGHIEPLASSDKGPSSDKKPKAKKGRRSKKFELDEDPEFHAPAAVIQAIQPLSEPKPKRKGRPRKSLQLSEAYVRDSSDEEMLDDTEFKMLHANTPPTQKPSPKSSPKSSQKPSAKQPQKASKPRGKPKKSASIVISSDEEEEDEFSLALKNSALKEPSKTADNSAESSFLHVRSSPKADSENHAQEEENLQSATTPVRKARKRKSGSIGIDGSRS